MAETKDKLITAESLKYVHDSLSDKIVDIQGGMIQQTPLFANSVDECTDTTKVYVLPDGYIYGYIMSESVVGGCTNLADPTSSDWKDGYRIISTGLGEQAGKTTTNLIPWNVGDVIRVTGISGFVTNSDRLCDTPNNTSAGNYVYVSALPTDYFGYEVIDGVHTFTLLKRTDNNCKYFRCCFSTPTDPSTVIITKNEEITEGTIVKDYAWGNTGHAFVPTDYEDRIIEVESEATALSNRIIEVESEATALSNRISENTANITQLDERVDIIESGNTSSVPTFWQSAIASAKEKILAKHNLGGVGCVSFVLTSDIHASAGIDEKGKRFGIVAKAIMDEANIPLFVSTGDLMSQSSHADVSNVYAELTLVKSWLEPIPFYQQALVMGNHDGAWGDTTSGYYYKQLPLEIVYNQIYRKQAMDLRRVSGDNGTYYYLDNESQKMRYIMLNSHNTPSYAENEDGTAVYDRFHTDCMCQDQYDWLTNVALDMPDGYTACLFMHSPYPGGWQLMVGIVDAYNNKSTYNNSFTDSENTWRNSTINVDFSNVKGTIAGVFAGHTHIDAIRHVGDNPMYSTCPLIITPNSVGGAVKDGTTRTDGTDTEFVMDIVTVDTKNRNIYITRLGAGNDREISY